MRKKSLLKCRNCDHSFSYHRIIKTDLKNNFWECRYRKPRTKDQCYGDQCDCKKWID